MKEARIIELLKAVGSERVHSDGNDVHGSCPLAPWTHEKGKDRHPSFGVLINNSGPSKYNCFSCKTRGKDLKMLVWRWMELTGKSLTPEMNEWLHETELLDLAEGGDGLVYDAYPEMRSEDTLPEEWWGPFKGGVPRYILDRGISIETCRSWGLGHDRDRHRLMFPVRNQAGELVSIIARTVRSETFGAKYVTFTGTKKGRYLYGENMRVSGDKIFVVEGTMDALHVWQHGFRDVVAVLGSVVTKDQARTLVEWDKPVYLFFDSDLAGIQGMLGAVNLLRGRVPVFVMKQLEGRNDPAEYSKDELSKALLMADLGDVWEGTGQEYVRKIKEARRKKRGVSGGGDGTEKTGSAEGATGGTTEGVPGGEG